MSASSPLDEGADVLFASKNGADNIRPVIYVVNATVAQQGIGSGNKINDAGPDNEPVIQSSLSGDHDDSLYEAFLTSLQNINDGTENSNKSSAVDMGRWRKDINVPDNNKIVQEFEIDEEDVGSTSYSKDNPQVNFMSRRAHVVSVSRRHAFPPSKCPHGKMNGMTSMIGETHGSIGNAWLSSYSIQNEGILPSGWFEKHTQTLPSALVVVTTVSEASINNGDVDRHVIQAVEDFRMTLAEKRIVPIHLVCLTNCNAAAASSDGRTREHNMTVLKEKICESCYLPQSQVFILNYPKDLEPDEFETAVLRSPYRSGATTTQDINTSTNTTDAVKKTLPAMMNPQLRQLDRHLRDSSALYYSRLAEAHERKLSLWRNRYHSSNTSFEVNTLIAGIRCARYALKVATMREFQMRTGATSTWSSVENGGTKWTDKGSLSMRFYEEAYRWVVELHRRAVTWRATSNTNSGTTDLSTPRNATSSNPIMSPNITQSPGGGIGVELPLPSYQPEVADPPAAIAATPPPTKTAEKGSGVTKDIVLYANLWRQCRAVASITSAKLLCSSNGSNSKETVDQWKRHRLIFLASPQGIRDYNPTQYDDFFGPVWYRMLFATEELHTYARTIEAQLRRDMLLSSKDGTAIPKPSYHQDTAPWKDYAELAEALIGLGAELKRQEKMVAPTIDMDVNSTVNFVGSKAFGGERLSSETQRDHRGIALDYILHALDLFEVAETSASPLINTGDAKTSNASARLHYLAGRLLMSNQNPVSAAVHLKIAVKLTKTWPSLQLSMQRALLVCEERCLAIEDGPAKSAREEESRVGCVKLLLEPESCSLLTEKEIKEAQSKAWKSGCKEVVWKGDPSDLSRPPFDFALSFLESTHAMSGDSVMACLSIKTQVDFQLHAKTITLITSVGTFKIPTTDLCFNKTQLQSWLKSPSSERHIQGNPKGGVHFAPNEVAYILTEISLPSDFSSVDLGNMAIDNNFYTPKSGKLTNMGLTHASGNVCETLEERVTPTGKPVPVASLPGSSAKFLGGIPFVCHGVELELGSLEGSSAVSSSPMKIRVEKSRLLSPLGRTGSQMLQMEECGYMAHAWSRPEHQRWCLGPRCLRILGPRPQMSVKNLTEPDTNGIAIEGTVNRIIFMLQVGPDVDCRGVRLSIRCRNSNDSVSNEAEDDVTVEGGGTVAHVEPKRRPLFVKRSSNDNPTPASNENDAPLPPGWEPRNDVATYESNVTASVITSHLEAGKSMLLPLDLYRPINGAGAASDEDDSCTTTYEISISYRQVRTVNGITQPNDLGDQVVVVRHGTVTWIPPFTADFSPVNGTLKPFPCGVKHSSNVVHSSSTDPSGSSVLVAADGERIRMQCHLKTKELGNNVAASIEYVANENETNEQQKYLYSSADSGLFFAQSKQGSRLSLSYSFTAKVNAALTGAIPLGTISVGWKPVGLTLSQEMTPANADNSLMDEFGLEHGPLILPIIAPMTFHGPICQVLDAPFKAKMLKCPSAPKVGTPFRVSYQLTNQTAKSQTLKVSLTNDPSGGATSSNSQLLVTGKMKGEMQMAPWEEKVLSFTFMSMIAGKVSRPCLSVSSGRHQTWVINESNANSHTFFVMP